MSRGWIRGYGAKIPGWLPVRELTARSLLNHSRKNGTGSKFFGFRREIKSKSFTSIFFFHA